MSFQEHIVLIGGKANSVIGMIKRTFQPMYVKMFLYLYKNMIRPILEHGNVTWCPHLNNDIVAIEKIQRRVIKIVTTLRYLPCKERLQRLYLTTLELRRRRSDLLQTYTIFDGNCAIDHMLFVEQCAN